MRYDVSSSFVTVGKHAAPAPRDALTILLTVGGLAALRCVKPVGTFRMTHWAFTYEHGFIKRGLVGEIVSCVFGPVTPTIITFLSSGAMLLLASVLVYLFISPALKSERVGAWLFAIVAVTHSATIPHFVFDLGRFDQINLLILLGCLFILSRPSPVLRLTVLPPLCLIGLLIHEAFFFMFLPLIFAVWIYEERVEWIWPKSLVLVGLVASTWAISTYGSVANFTLEDYTALLQDRHSFKIVEASVEVLFRGLKDTVAFNLRELKYYSGAHITRHVVLVLALLPTFSLF